MTDTTHDPLADDIQQPENARATVGHNQPPEETPPELPADPLVAAALLRVAEATRWLTAHPDATKWDEDLAAKVNTTIGDVDRAHGNLDGQRLQEGRDFRDAQAKKYTVPLTLLETAKGKLVALRRAYLKMMEDRLAEQQRKIQEAADKARQEAEEATQRLQRGSHPDPLSAELAAQEAIGKATALQAQATEAPRKAYVSGGAKSTGLQDHWFATIEDITLAFKNFNKKGHPAKPILEETIRAVILSIATNEAKAVKDLTKAPPGIKFHKDRR